MKPLIFDYQATNLISQADINHKFSQLLATIQQITAARNTEYASEYASINLPFDEELLQTITSTVKEKKTLQPSILVVIGIGGSNLATIAILEALRGTFYNNHHETKVYFVDTVDTDNVADIAQLVEDELTAGENILINVISKSGTTTETIANFEIFLKILKNHRPYNYHQFVVATTDYNSALWQLGQKEEFALLAIPKNVGGRYSAFSAVGLFPLCFLDIDIKKLREGAQHGYAISTQKNLDRNYAGLSAAIIATHYEHGTIIHDTFLFSKALTTFGAWYRQLSAESLGKAFDKKDEPVNIGLLPTISIGSTDLHSVGQLYFAGPHNRFTTFINVEKNRSNIALPEYQEYESLVQNIQGKPLETIMNAILQGTKKAYHDDNHPFVSFTLPEKSAFYIGQLMQIKMMEIMYLGHLLNINPFDQPEVERYKAETKNILTRVPNAE